MRGDFSAAPPWPQILQPDWPPIAGVSAGCTTRVPPYDAESNSADAAIDFNVALHTGADQVAAMSNREKLSELHGADVSWQWLQQVHGSEVYRSTGAIALEPIADACITTEVGRACCVMTADCLPILVSATDASVVAAIHGGWRSLAAGIIAKTFAKLGRLTARDFVIWLGPAISQPYFEVGLEVVATFLADLSLEEKREFVASCCVDFDANLMEALLKDSVSGQTDWQPLGKCHLDLCAVVHFQCRHLPVTVYGGNYCSYAEPEKFYSYRRAQDKGRFCSYIYINPVYSD